MPPSAGRETLTTIKTVSIPHTHRHASHAARNGHKDLVGRVEAIAGALLLQLLRRLVVSLRSMPSPSRDMLMWQLRRRALQRAAEQRKRERRRRIAIATAAVAAGAALTAARALSRR
jgi:hypothetical protein